MLSLSNNYQADVVGAFNSASRYLDDLLNIHNPYFEQMVSQIYSTELQLNKVESSYTEAPFSDLDLSITNDIVSTKIFDKRGDFNFAPLPMVYTSCNLFVLQEYVLMLMTSARKTKF